MVAKCYVIDNLYNGNSGNLEWGIVYPITNTLSKVKVGNCIFSCVGHSTYLIKPIKLLS